MSSRWCGPATGASWVAGFVMVASAMGCSANRNDHGADAKPRAEAGQAADAVGRANKDSAADQISLELSDAPGLADVLAKHRGKVVLVDFWATWCGPCVEQFPHTVELARKHRGRGLAVVSVSMDNPEGEPQVRAFLDKQSATFDNLLSNYASPVTATKEFGLPGPVPCYRVYDRQGDLVHEFSVDPQAAKQFTAADIEEAIEALL